MLCSRPTKRQSVQPMARGHQYPWPHQKACGPQKTGRPRQPNQVQYLRRCSTQPCESGRIVSMMLRCVGVALFGGFEMRCKPPDSVWHRLHVLGSLPFPMTIIGLVDSICFFFRFVRLVYTTVVMPYSEQQWILRSEHFDTINFVLRKNRVFIHGISSFLQPERSSARKA